MKEKKAINVTVIGGGTGSFVVLSGLKKYPLNLTAITTVTDDGGSTGRLRDEFGFLPVGDLRQCLAALSDDGYLKDLLLYRFEKGEKGLRGHNLGNLILTALDDLAGSESKALEAAGSLFRLKGKVLPVSLQLVKLKARYKSGKTIISEHLIEENCLNDDCITDLSTHPPAVINPKAKQAIKDSHYIILGPGDLYDSTIANLVIKGIRPVIRTSKAKLIYVVNLMTLKSQTNHFSAGDHLRELEKYLGKKVDNIIINKTKIPPPVLKQYEDKGEYPVADDLKGDKRVIRADLLSKKKITKNSSDILQRSLIRHSGSRLALTISNIIKKG